MRLLTPARARAGRRRALLPAGAAALAAFGCAAVPATAGAVASPTPDRAYELVSSADTGGLDVASRIGGQAVMAGTGAGSALFATLGTAPGGQAGDLGFAPLVGRRTATGWRNDAVVPGLTPGVPRPTGLPAGSVVGATGDLSSVLVATNQPMVAGVDTTVQNVFRRAFGPGETGAAALVAAPASQLSYMTPQVVGVSADGRSALFQSPDQLTPDAPAPSTGNLYLARDGQVTLVSRRPDGTPVPGGVSFNQPTHPSAHLLSPDGRTAFFVSGSDNRIYVNRDGAVVNASAPQGGTDGTPTFWAASADGTKLLFTDTGALTPGSSPAGRDAYMYDVASGALTVLTPSSVTGANPPVMRFVAASANADTVYFVAFNTALSPDTPLGVARPLYRWHAGAINYVGRIDTASVNTLATFTSVTADGRYLVYPSAQDNTAQPTGGTTQLYRYDAVAGTTACVSCPPDGAAASTATEPYGVNYGIFAVFPFTTPNAVSADGHVAFTTTAALSPLDVNGKDDVYEWRPGGVTLVSSGTDPAGALLGDLSRDGTDLYFTTRDALVGADDDEDADLYDARRGGGLPDAAPPKGAGACAGDACQGAPPAPPAAPPVATVTFAGPGNAEADGSIPVAPAAVKATKGAVRGGRLTVTVRVPSAGRITASGPRVRTARRTATKAGSYRLTLALTAAARRSLARHKRVKVSVKVGFLPTSEKASNATLSLTVKA
jgi:hypothetical protein